MSGGLEALQLQEDDVAKCLAANIHNGVENLETAMEPYIFKRKQDGVAIINIRKTWEKLLLAARIIVGIENPADVTVISSQPAGTRAVLKFAVHTGATAIAGRFTPGTFTNQIQKAFREPRLLIVTNPRDDHQAVTEASYVNVPIIAFCNSDAPLRHIDVAIPCNNKGFFAVGTMWWMLAREVLRLRGTISRSPQTPWDVMPDLYFYRDPQEIEKEEEQEIHTAAPEEFKPKETAPAADDWSVAVPPLQEGVGATEWSSGTKNWADDAVPGADTDWNAGESTWT